MDKLRGIINLFPRIRVKAELGEKELRRFDSELLFLNLTRLKYMAYIGLPLALFLLYSDFFIEELWQKEQLSYFIILDVIFAMAALFIFLFTNIIKVKSPSELGAIHSFFVSCYIIFHVLWCAIVSGIEYESILNFPTFLIGIFSLSIIFLRRGILIPVSIMLGLFVIGSMIYIKGFDTLEVFRHTYALLSLVILSIFISKILLYTRADSFIARVKLERLNQSLDEEVNLRTEELTLTNEWLRQEISNRKKYEIRLIEEKKKAEEADRLKSVFLANISHEIRTPLNGILGFSELLLHRIEGDEKVLRYLHIINSNSYQLLKIIEDIIDISVIEANQIKFKYDKFSVKELLDNSMERAENYRNEICKSNVSLNKVSDDQDSVLFSDRKRVQQILNNLIFNGIKFTKEGNVNFGYNLNGEKIIFFVEDTGIGLNNKQIDYIFKPFRQVDETSTRSYGGNGLGLAISKGIIEKLGGNIWLDTSYTRGARFLFSLPLQK